MEWLAWSGNLSYVVGCTAIARKRPILGQAVNTFANLLYTIYGISIESVPLWTLSLFSAAINVYGIRNWNRKGHGEEKGN